MPQRLHCPNGNPNPIFPRHFLTPPGPQSQVPRPRKPKKDWTAEQQAAVGKGLGIYYHLVVRTYLPTLYPYLDLWRPPPKTRQPPTTHYILHHHHHHHLRFLLPRPVLLLLLPPTTQPQQAQQQHANRLPAVTTCPVLACPVLVLAYSALPTVLYRLLFLSFATVDYSSLSILIASHVHPGHLRTAPINPRMRSRPPRPTLE